MSSVEESKEAPITSNGAGSLFTFVPPAATFDLHAEKVGLQPEPQQQNKDGELKLSSTTEPASSSSAAAASSSSSSSSTPAQPPQPSEDDEHEKALVACASCLEKAELGRSLMRKGLTERAVDALAIALEEA